MPLTPLNKVHRDFPSAFAEKMLAHSKQRAQFYQQQSESRAQATQLHQQYRQTKEEDDVSMEPLGDDAEISEMCDSDGEVAGNSLGHSQSRLTPEMRMLRTMNSMTPRSTTSESESEASSTATTPRPTKSPSGRPKMSPSPRGFPIKLQDSPRPLPGFTPAFAVSPRRARQSPRTTGSLDNVDLWEESDNDSSDLDHKVHALDPSQTFDFSDLRRSKSPVECKRNKLSKEPEKQEEFSCLREKPRDKQFSAARARAVRRSKQIFPNPAVAKPAPRLRIANPNTNVADAKAKPTSQTMSTRKKKLLPQRESRLAAKFPGSLVKDTDGVQKFTMEKKQFTTNVREKSIAKNVNQSHTKTQQLSATPLVNNEKHFLKTPEYSGEHSLISKGLKPDKEVFGTNDSAPNIGNEEASISRKVKFNSFVTVRDNEISTLDFLKHSNNSAQMFKNKYLRPPDKEQTNSCYGSGDVNLMLQTIS